MIRMAPGMDQMYMQYLDTQFKKSEDAQVKAGFEKSYKILSERPHRFCGIATHQSRHDERSVLGQAVTLPGHRDLPRS